MLCSSGVEKEKERNRFRDTERERERQTDRERETERERDRQTERERERERERQADKPTVRVYVRLGAVVGYAKLNLCVCLTNISWAKMGTTVTNQ